MSESGPEREAPAGSASISKATGGWWRIAAIASSLLAVALAIVAAYTRPTPTPIQVARFQVNPPEKARFVALGGAGASGGTISPDGSRLVFGDVLTFRTGGNVTTQFAWFDRAGRLPETLGPPGSYLSPALSRDEKKLALGRRDQQAAGDIWLLDLARQTLSRFTFNPGSEQYPIWSPDGSRIFYTSNQEGLPPASSKRDSSGTGSEQLVLKGNITATAQVSPDGKFLLYFESLVQTNMDVFAWPLTAPRPDEGRKPIPVVQTPFTDGEPQFSQDGRWIAYVSTETGREEVYVQPFPVTGAKWQTSAADSRCGGPMERNCSL